MLRLLHLHLLHLLLTHPFLLLLSELGSFAWQGYLVRAVDLTGLSTPVSVVVALLGAGVVAFIVAVMITGFRSTARD